MKDLKINSGFEEKIIKIKVPVKVAYDAEKMRRVSEIVLSELGCAACHSGFDLRFDIQRQFVFNEKLELLNKYELR